MTQGGKEQEMKHRRRKGSKNKDKFSSRKIDHRIFWFFSVQKNRYGDDEKKGKEEVWKNDQEQKREKKNEVKQKKIHKNETWDRDKRKKKVRKEKEMNKKMKGKSEQRKKWWKKKGKMLEETVKQKRDGTKAKNEGFWADFSWEEMKREKGLTMNFKNSSTITRIISHFFKKQENRKRRKNGRKKKLKMFSLTCWKIFKDTSKQESGKWETDFFFQKKKKEKENKKGELRQKTRNHFSRHRKTRQNRNINVKHVQQKRETDKIVFWNRRKKKRKFLQKFTKIQKIVKKGTDRENKETIQGQETEKI